jgi:hypothetical protein
MDNIYRIARAWPGRWALAMTALLFGLASAALAQTPNEDPPGRVANLSWRDGGVVFAPAGEDEWTDLPVNRPLTRGDRLWTDRGARAELHLGSATMQVGSESHLGFTELDDDAAQMILMQGTLNARVRELETGENFEIDTPNLAMRASQPGDYRVDVSGDGITRVIVRSGLATVYGDGGHSLRLGPGQEISVSGRTLAQVADPFGGRDAFDQWVAERNQREDQSVAARHIPRSVIGYSQLDAYGSWDTVPEYGAVWYPRVTVANWAPYRHGHWSWIEPWGWTWIDDAPWGFAPFHYGRWAQIGPRWAWVPGRFERRPAYAPALVVFLGGSSGGTHWSLSVGSGPGVAWYPLAPGEAWRPSYRHSSTYLTRLNRDWRYRDRDHVHSRHAGALTAVPLDDFRHGRPVRSNWRSISPSAIAQAPRFEAPVRPVRDREMWRGDRPRLQAQPPATAPAWFGRRGFAGAEDSRPQQQRAQREQERLQRDAERVERGTERGPRDQAWRRQEAPRMVPDPRQQPDRAQREARQEQHQQTVREMQERRQQEHQQRQQQDRAQREARQAQQQQQVRAMQERQRQEQQMRHEQQQQQVRTMQERQRQERALNEQQQRQAYEQNARAVQRQQQEQEQGRRQLEQAQREAAQRQRQVMPTPQPQGQGGQGQGQRGGQRQERGAEPARIGRDDDGPGRGRGGQRNDDDNNGRGRGQGRNG